MSDPSDFDPALPEELWPAVSELRHWIEALNLAEQKSAQQNKPLYHYTDEAALKSILEKEEIWCFSHLHQTDKSELKYSLDIARETLRELERSEDFFVKNFAYCIRDLIENNDVEAAFDFYLFSISRHRDDPGQWKEFGRKGHGFSIGFAPNLFNQDQDTLNPSANRNLFVGNVTYGENEIRKRHHTVFEGAAALVSRWAKQNRELVTKHKPAVYFSGMAKEVIAGQLIWNCLTGKNVSYQDEQEVRFLLLGMPDRFDAFRKKHCGRNYVASPLRLRTPKNVTEIIVGAATPDGSENMVAQYLISQGYSYGIPISRSRT